MPVISRYTWRRFAPVTAPMVGDTVLTPAVFGTFASVETRLFPPCVRVMPPIRARYPRSYGSTVAVVSGVIGARLLQKNAAATVTILGA